MGNTHNLTLIILLIAATALVLIGSCLFVVTMSAVNWDFSVLGTKNVTNEYAVGEDFNSISVKTDTARVVFLPSDDGSCRVTCVEREKETHSVSVTDSSLNIQLVDSRAWYEHVSIFSLPTTVTVYLPKAEYDSLAVNTSTGDVKIAKNFTFGGIEIQASTGTVELENISAGSLNISLSTGAITAKSVNCSGDVSVRVTTGDVRLADVACKNLNSIGGTGDLTLTSVVASESFYIERSTGNITFDGCDADTLTVKTGTGNVSGSLLSKKIFFTSTSTGKISVPKCTSGGACEVSTTTGDIIIEIKP